MEVSSRCRWRHRRPVRFVRLRSRRKKQLRRRALASSMFIPPPPPPSSRQFWQGRRHRSVRGDARWPSPKRRRRSAGIRPNRRRPPPYDLQSHGLRRSGDRRVERRARPGTVPHDCVWVRRAVNSHPHDIQQPVLLVFEASRLDEEGLVGAVPVRGREQEVHDAPH
jgi:hypothetical protein